MENRSQKLLKAIIDIYIKTARPVASKTLCDEESFEVSSATIRNDMYELESQGYIAQPHTSAGRIPTISGYRYYLDNLLSIKSPNSNEQKELEKAYKKDIRDLAKLLVDKTNLATIVGLAPNDYYFTGLFNLFSQPEFEDYKMVLSMSQVVDSLEKAISEIYNNITAPEILIGPDNPFSEDCSVAIAPLPDNMLLAILGPTRMDYNRVLGLLEQTVKIIK
ncbi:DeoR family transcriptional regulator [Patescibacteria group bacterium]|nr:DeoR family transcriptional regulator [Patescibacteria group bacterium]